MLLVPLPFERVHPDDINYPSREGQSDFRALILAAYKQCAVSGCTVDEVLEAAHIIPYVDSRSNLVVNGICLRADIHRLYDRNLIRIGDDCVVRVDETIMDTGYREFDGRRIALPANQSDWPNGGLMNLRHKYV